MPHRRTCRTARSSTSNVDGSSRRPVLRRSRSSNATVRSITCTVASRHGKRSKGRRSPPDVDADATPAPAPPTCPQVAHWRSRTSRCSATRTGEGSENSTRASSAAPLNALVIEPAPALQCRRCCSAPARRAADPHQPGRAAARRGGRPPENAGRRRGSIAAALAAQGWADFSAKPSGSGRPRRPGRRRALPGLPHLAASRRGSRRWCRRPAVRRGRGRVRWPPRPRRFAPGKCRNRAGGLGRA